MTKDIILQTDKPPDINRGGGGGGGGDPPKFSQKYAIWNFKKM